MNDQKIAEAAQASIQAAAQTLNECLKGYAIEQPESALAFGKHLAHGKAEPYVTVQFLGEGEPVCVEIGFLTSGGVRNVIWRWPLPCPAPAGAGKRLQ